MTQFELALCNAAAENLLGRLALCQLKLSEDGQPPEWVQLVPSGAKIKALDGRDFRNKSPEDIVKAFNDDPRDLPIDWEHASEIKAPEGEPAPAAGWVVAMEVREGGAIWGKVEWTPRGKASIETREYRYLSPAFILDDAKNILELVSAALTNRPAFNMPALAHHKENPMDPKLLEALGLKEDATPEDVLAAIAKLKAPDPSAELETVKKELETARGKLETAETELENARNAHPDLSKYVPRAEYDAAVARAKTAEDKLEDGEKAIRQKEIDAEIDAALKVGKITPASKDFYLATCAQDGGLEKFREFLKTAPKIGDPSDLDDEPPPGNGDPKATQSELAIAAACGVSEEDYLKAKAN